MTDIFAPLSELQALLIQLRFEGLSTTAIKRANDDMDVERELNEARELLGVSTEEELGWMAIALGIVEGPECFVPSRQLTPAEESLIPYILRGISDYEIEAESGRSYARVRTHISNLMLKFGAQDRMMLAGSLYKYQNL